MYSNGCIFVMIFEEISLADNNTSCLQESKCNSLCVLLVRIRPSHGWGPGSIPGRDIFSINDFLSKKSWMF